MLNYTNSATMSVIRVEACKCDRCGYVWLSTSTAPGLPNRCAKCKSPAWNSSPKDRPVGQPGSLAVSKTVDFSSNLDRPANPTMPSPGARRPVVQSPEPKHSDVWAPGTSRKTQADFLTKYGREPLNRTETDAYAKRGY